MSQVKQAMTDADFLKELNIFRGIISSDSIVFSDFQNVWIAFLTILIPLGIAVLSEYFRKLGAKDDYAVLDLHVILDWILNFKFLLLTTGLLFIPGLFWSQFGSFTKYLTIVGWLVGTFFLVNILIQFYKWTKGNKDELRLTYYRNLNKTEDFLTVSESIWSAKTTNSRQELEYLRVFLRRLKKLTGYDKN